MENTSIFKKVVFTAEKESFILRALIERVCSNRVDGLFVPFTVNDLNAVKDAATLFVLYLDDGIKQKEDTLHFLIDMVSQNDYKIILVGEEAEIDYTTKQMNADLIYKKFVRPVNNDEFITAIKAFFDKSNSGEFQKSIMIVDDDPQYLSLVRQWLKDSYRVFMANSGLQAIKYLGKNKVDLILLDHEMPVTSGPQVLEMLRSDPETSSIPVFFLTGKSDKESVMAVVSLRPEGYFLKDIKKEELLEKLKEFFIMHSA